MKSFYKILIDGMDDTLTVTGIVRGAAWVGAELSNGSFGIAMNTEGESVERMFPSLMGLGAKTAAQAVMSWSFNEASEAMAVINAFYNTTERMELLGIVGCGGRLHGNKKLHVFSPRSFFVANVLGWVPGGMGAVYAPSSGIPQHTDGFLLYI